MISRARSGMIFGTCALLSACSAGRVIFVTKTSIAIDGDTSAPPSVSVGYDRVEAYIAPRYPQGGVPPVVASLQGDLAVFNPQISQLYATGQAALNIVGKAAAAPTCAPADLKVDTSDKTQDKAVMAFMTTTTLGLKLGFSTGGGPSSITFGYKRKEASIIPMGKVTAGTVETDAYPSVLASINVNVQSASSSTAAVGISDFFATGVAADCLSTSSDIQNNFSAAAKTGTKPATPTTNPAKGKTELVR